MYKDEYPIGYEPPEGVSSASDLCDKLRENMVDYFLGKRVINTVSLFSCLLHDSVVLKMI